MLFCGKQDVNTALILANITGCTALTSCRGVHIALCQEVVTVLLRGHVTLTNVNTSKYGWATVIKFRQQA